MDLFWGISHSMCVHSFGDTIPWSWDNLALHVAYSMVGVPLFLLSSKKWPPKAHTLVYPLLDVAHSLMHDFSTWLGAPFASQGYMRKRPLHRKTWLDIWSFVSLELNWYFSSWSKFCCKDSIFPHVWCPYLGWSFMVVSLFGAFILCYWVCRP